MGTCRLQRRPAGFAPPGTRISSSKKGLFRPRPAPACSLLRLFPLFVFFPRQSQKPFLHLRGRRSCERNDKNAGGVNARLQQSLDSVCNYCRFSGPRTREDHHRSIPVFQGHHLCLIKIHYSAASRSSIPFLIRARDSSFPMISMISVAPAGVICFPDTAVRIGHITKPVFTPLSATYLERA